MTTLEVSNPTAAEAKGRGLSKPSDDDSYFTHFQQTYGPVLENPPSLISAASTNKIDDSQIQVELVENSEGGGASSASDCDSEHESTLYFWELLLYIPIVLQSLFGTLHIVRSLVLGHALRWFLQQASLRAPDWFRLDQIEMFLRKIDTHSWPPPALLFLGVLTITALIVHPDGFTWVFLRQLRYVSHFQKLPHLF